MKYIKAEIVSVLSEPVDTTTSEDFFDKFVVFFELLLSFPNLLEMLCILLSFNLLDLFGFKMACLHNLGLLLVLLLLHLLHFNLLVLFEFHLLFQFSLYNGLLLFQFHLECSQIVCIDGTARCQRLVFVNGFVEFA